jgi:CBS domain-containing protein
MQNNQDSSSASAGDVQAMRKRDDFLRLMFFQASAEASTHLRIAKTDGPIRSYHPLPQSGRRSSAGYCLPDDRSAGVPVGAESAAIEVMTDLRQVTPVTIGSFASIEQANETMIAHGVRALFVADDHRRVLGLMTSTDVLGEKPMQLTQQRGIRHGDVLVRDIMTPEEHLEAIDLAVVLRARVGDVVATLKQSGRRHALVVNESAESSASGAQVVCGIFSLTQIARQLGIALETVEIGRTFAEIESAIGPDSSA